MVLVNLKKISFFSYSIYANFSPYHLAATMLSTIMNPSTTETQTIECDL